MDELTPPLESDEPKRQPSQHLQAYQATNVGLVPAEPRQAFAELAACLTLVAPSGMASSDRSEWLKVAQMTLADLPADLLRRGCAKARETCRFASEIVPAILNELEYAWPRRQEEIRFAKGPQSFVPAPKPQQAIEYVDPAEVTKLIRSIRNAGA
jgi:hypothetical protein